MRKHGREIVAEATAQATGDLDAHFDAQRLALGKAVLDHHLTEEVARDLIEDIDLRQAAVHTAPAHRDS
jgi:CPA1 family monovalent cation:H+ antiporter